MTTSVIIITLNRPDCVAQCLAALRDQEPQPDQVIVVDASPDDRTRQVVGDYPGVVYVRNKNGFGRMTASRNIGLMHATGDVIAFVDDDAYAHPGWLKNLVATYTDARIGAVGGRALNGQRDEATEGRDRIGRLLPNGMLTGYFAADPGQVIEVDHMIGCNMSFRREVLAELGGFREDCGGISGVREDTDMCLRVTRLGYRILLNPAACVDHEGAPQAKGKRFDLRYTYYGQRNHLLLLIRHYGLGSAQIWRYLLASALQTGQEAARKAAAAVVRPMIVCLGKLAGIARGIWLRRQFGHDPRRGDEDGQRLRAWLTQEPQQQPESTQYSERLVASGVEEGSA